MSTVGGIETRATKKQRLEREQRAVKDGGLTVTVVRGWRCDGSDGEKGRCLVSVAATSEHIVVAECCTHSIRCFSPEGVLIRKWGSKGRKNAQFSHPKGLAVGVCNGVRASLLVQMRSVFALSLFPPGLLPLCAAYVGDECLLVADSRNNRIQMFQTDGTFIRKWGTAGGGEGQFQWPTGCAVSSNGKVYVTDKWNRRIQVFDMEGTFLYQWTTYRLTGGMYSPANITISAVDTVYVTDTLQGSIASYSLDGKLLHYWHPSFGLPFACGAVVAVTDTVASGDKETVYVASGDHQCIWELRIDGSVLCKWSTKNKEYNVEAPVGLAYAAFDNLFYMTDALQRYVVAIRLRS